jgi:colanic acid/amylovoran biosynthesis glycosyltransferase
MRVAYLTTRYPSVSTAFIRREIRELERRGHEVLRLAIGRSDETLVDGRDQADLLRTVQCLSLPFFTIAGRLVFSAIRHPWGFLRAAWVALGLCLRGDRGLASLVQAAALSPVLSRFGAEHLHVHFGTNAASVARLLRRLGGPPYSITMHGPDEFDAAIESGIGEKVREARFVVGVSDFCAAQIRRWAPVEHWGKIHVIHTSVDEDFLDSMSPTPESNILLSIGRLTPQKGHLLLLEAAQLLLAENESFRLVLAGDGELRPQIERRIEELGLSGVVEITGWVDESTIRQLLSQSRVLVQPSFAEGLPVVLLEAFASGRAVISTYVGGIPELVHHRLNGWLVPAGNVKALADAVRDALKTPTARLEAMAFEGRRLVLENHSTAAGVDRLEDLLLEAIGGQPKEDVPVLATAV